MPAFGAEVFRSRTSLVLVTTTALVGATFAQTFASEEAFASCNQRELRHVSEEFAGTISTARFWSSADAIFARFAVGAEVAVVDSSVAVIVFTVADFFGRGSRACAAFGTFAVVGADLGSRCFTNPFAYFAGLAKVGEGFVGFAVTVVVFLVANFRLGFTAGALLGFVAAGLAAGAGLLGLPYKAARLVLGAGLKAVLVRASGGTRCAFLGRTAFVYTGTVVANFVGTGTGLFFGTPHWAAVFVLFTNDVFPGSFGVRTLALLVTDGAGNIGAVLTRFPTFTRCPFTGAFALLCTFHTDLHIGGSTTLNIPRFTLSTSLQRADAEGFVGACAILVFQALHTTTGCLVAETFPTVLIATANTLVFGATIGGS